MRVSVQTAIGHWSEMMFPLYSILRKERDFQTPPTTFVLLHLKRVHLMEWVRAVVATTLSLAPQQPLPPLLMQAETDSIWKQVRECPGSDSAGKGHAVCVQDGRQADMACMRGHLPLHESS